MFTIGQRSDESSIEDQEIGTPAHQFYLDVLVYDGKRLRVPLPQTELVIGRSANRCDLVIDDLRVSRVHLRVSREPDIGITLTDLYSANGTAFENRMLTPGLPITWLINQTAVIGDTRLTLRYGNIESKRLA